MNFNPTPFYPTHPILKECVAYFYFLKTNEGFTTRYFAFPHTHTVLNLHLQATAIITQTSTSVFGDKNAGSISLIQCIRDFPMLAELGGEIDKVTIIFKPLGINNFIKRNIDELVHQPSQYFNEWNNLDAYQNLLADFKKREALNERAKLLEEFLLSVYCEHKVTRCLKPAVSFLCDFETERSIEQIAEAVNLTSRTLNRMFHRHLGVSPVTFKKVARFRHSLEHKIFADQLKRMADLAYQSNFYDVAYFNKIYKKMTGNNPQQFFKQIDRLADDQLIFHFQKL